MMALRKISLVFLILVILLLVPFLPGCKHVESPDDIVIIPLETDTPKEITVETIERATLEKEKSSKKDTRKTPHIVAKPRTDNFTKSETREIEKDGYLAYYYRRKYSADEIKITWNAVNTLFPDYSYDEKHQATRSILAYHWLVYRTTSFHYMPDNLAVTRKFEHLMDKFAKLHNVPVEMVKAVITWENSGGVTKESWAACVGVGQLSMGAVESAHGYYAKQHQKMKELARIHRMQAEKFNFPLENSKAVEYEKMADFYDVAGRHKRLAKQLGIADERLIPECNVEDAVIYLKMNYESYNHRMDLAISAYHNGSFNNNDIIRSYLSRIAGINIASSNDYGSILSAINNRNLKFIDLWNDVHSRDMLNGLRTVYGDITADHNKHLALGDESDIYVWKVAAAYAALQASDETVASLVKKYAAEWDIAECQGLKLYSSIAEISKDIKNGRLVKLPPVYTNSGISDLKGGTEDYHRYRASYNYYVLPETAGMLLSVVLEYRKRAGDPQLKIPLKAALDSRVLELHNPGSIPKRYHTHLQGAAVEIDFEKASKPHILRQIIEEMYMHDRIYWIRKDGVNRVCVNPRFGKRFHTIYRNFADKHRSQ
jgi:hypothetical protein